MGFGRGVQAEFDRDIKINQFGINAEPYIEDFTEGWEDIQGYQNIPVVGNIAAWLMSGVDTYDQEGFDKMATWQQWGTLHGAQHEIVEGYEDAEEKLQSSLNQAALFDAINIGANLFFPDAAALLNLGGSTGKTVRGISPFGEGDDSNLGFKAVKDDEGNITWQKMTILDALLNALPFVDKKGID